MFTQEQDAAEQDLLLPDQEALDSAKSMMTQTIELMSKRKGLIVAHFSMDDVIDVATYRTIDGEPVYETTAKVERNGDKSVRRLVYFDRGKRCFEIGYGDEKVLDPVTRSYSKAPKGTISYENGVRNTHRAQHLVNEKLEALRKAYA